MIIVLASSQTNKTNLQGQISSENFSQIQNRQFQVNQSLRDEGKEQTQTEESNLVPDSNGVPAPADNKVEFFAKTEGKNESSQQNVRQTQLETTEKKDKDEDSFSGGSREFCTLSDQDFEEITGNQNEINGKEEMKGNCLLNKNNISCHQQQSISNTILSSFFSQNPSRGNGSLEKNKSDDEKFQFNKSLIKEAVEDGLVGSVKEIKQAVEEAVGASLKEFKNEMKNFVAETVNASSKEVFSQLFQTHQSLIESFIKKSVEDVLLERFAGMLKEFEINKDLLNKQTLRIDTLEEKITVFGNNLQTFTEAIEAKTVNSLQEKIDIKNTFDQIAKQILEQQQNFSLFLERIGSFQAHSNKSIQILEQEIIKQILEQQKKFVLILDKIDSLEKKSNSSISSIEKVLSDTKILICNSKIFSEMFEMFSKKLVTHISEGTASRENSMQKLLNVVVQEYDSLQKEVKLLNSSGFGCDFKNLLQEIQSLSGALKTFFVGLKNEEDEKLLGDLQETFVFILDHYSYFISQIKQDLDDSTSFFSKAKAAPVRPEVLYGFQNAIGDMVTRIRLDLDNNSDNISINCSLKSVVFAGRERYRISGLLDKIERTINRIADNLSLNPNNFDKKKYYAVKEQKQSKEVEFSKTKETLNK